MYSTLKAFQWKNIIVSSISGLDIAKQIKQICQKYLYTDIKVITLKYKDLVNTLDIANAEENYLKSLAHFDDVLLETIIRMLLA